jgi:hypothetical protein
MHAIHLHIDEAAVLYGPVIEALVWTLLPAREMLRTVVNSQVLRASIKPVLVF